MYVSVDRDRVAWKKMLNEDPGFKGTHILEVKGSGIPIRKSYLIAGIPRYILIDKNGLIIDSDAPRPSSKEIEIELERLLAK